jgi:hypothetical protein
MVVMKLGVNESSENRSNKQLFPTPAGIAEHQQVVWLSLATSCSWIAQATTTYRYRQ